MSRDWMPERPELPYFAYGLLQPGELGYHQVESFVWSQKRASIEGALNTRDGIPMLTPGRPGKVHGWLLEFHERADEAYSCIASFEPRDLYRWSEVVTDDHLPANVLIGRTTTGARPLEEEHWSGRDDPVFTHAMAAVRDVSDGPDGTIQFDSTRPDLLDWGRFFRVQMAYLLLWSAIERYLALVYGPSLEPSLKLTKLGEDRSFAHHLSRVSGSERRVYESRSRDSAVFDTSAPKRAAKYFYVVRSNLSHRGKGAWNDAEMVRGALSDLLSVFTGMLAESGISGARPPGQGQSAMEAATPSPTPSRALQDQ